jgi:protein gp37
MGRTIGIACTDHTFNLWPGCVRVSPPCDRCYAAALAKRTGRRDRGGRDLWDPHADRVRTSSDYWRQPDR